MWFADAIIGVCKPHKIILFRQPQTLAAASFTSFIRRLNSSSSLLAGVAIFLLEQADDLFGIAGRLFQVIVGELAPPLFGLTFHFLPLAFEDIRVHNVILPKPLYKLPRLLYRRSGQSVVAPVIIWQFIELAG